MILTEPLFCGAVLVCPLGGTRPGSSVLHDTDQQPLFWGAVSVCPLGGTRPGSPVLHDTDQQPLFCVLALWWRKRTF